MKTLVTTLLSAILSFTIYAQAKYNKIAITNDIELIKLADNTYIHVSYTQSPGYGRTSSNGLIFTNNGFACLLDTPMTDSLTYDLVNWITDTMHLKITGFVPNHWHVDCMGGLGYLQSIGIDSYANYMTIDIAKEKGLPQPSHGFHDSISFKVGNESIFCYYLGAAHSLDNIIVWIPSEKIIFTGCMVKNISAVLLGNTVDGDLTAWPVTLNRILQKFPDVNIVIPGHGDAGGLELINHTLELIKNN